MRPQPTQQKRFVVAVPVGTRHCCELPESAPTHFYSQGGGVPDKDLSLMTPGMHQPMRPPAWALDWVSGPGAPLEYLTQVDVIKRINDLFVCFRWATRSCETNADHITTLWRTFCASMSKVIVRTMLPRQRL